MVHLFFVAVVINIFYLYTIFGDDLFFFALGLTSLSGHIRTMPACNIGYAFHFIVLSHWNITPQALSCDISPGHIILATGQNVFSLNYPLYIERLTREFQLPICNFWLHSAGIEPPTFQIRSERPNHSATELVWDEHDQRIHHANNCKNVWLMFELRFMIISPLNINKYMYIRTTEKWFNQENYPRFTDTTNMMYNNYN